MTSIGIIDHRCEFAADDTVLYKNLRVVEVVINTELALE